MKRIMLLCSLMIMLVFPASHVQAVDSGDYVPEISLDININPGSSEIKGLARVWIPELRRLEFSLAGIEVSSLTLNRHDIRGSISKDGMLQVGPLNSSRKLVIGFSCKIPSVTDKHGQGNFISPEGVVLLDQWYPRFMGLARYDLQVRLPSGLKAVSEAEEIVTERHDDHVIYTFRFPHPRDAVTLVAGPYVKKVVKYEGIQLEAYFFPQDQGLASGYLDKLKYYVDLYRDILPPYPFRRFAVVENVLPTGFGMATYTLLGRAVVHLPFIVDTSLGHEFVHSWFGNSVYVDESQGNWCEGLTTYLSDALYRQMAGSGAEYRHEILVQYQAWVHSGNAISVGEFVQGTDRAVRAVGYGKAAMIFHMLANEVGKTRFRAAIGRLARDYRFRAVSWQTIKDIFEQESHRDLSWFFDQWLTRKDVPDLDFSKVTVEDGKAGEKRLSFTITQKTGTPYRIKLPLLVVMPGQEIKHEINIDKRVTHVSFEVPKRPYTIVADEDFNLMRRLFPDEYPPVLARVFGAEKKFFSVRDEDREKYGPIIKFFEQRGFAERKSGGHSHEDFRQGAFVVLGQPAGGMKMLAGETTQPKEGVKIVVKPNPLGRDSVVCTIEASSSEELVPILPKLPHYGKYSMLSFSGGRIREKAIFPATDGMRLEISRGITAIAAKSIFPVKKIVRYISGDRVIYVSEQHDQAGHHMAQLKVIKLLHERGIKLAVGMEMFQRPFQKVLDAYFAGKIDERRFLKDSEYFKRWGFDYHLYRPIVEYCRKNHIPLVALNLRKEISSKIAREGIKGLSAQERADLPAEIDTSNRHYREHLRDIFSQHSSTDVDNFDYFFQAQLSWDETMAQTVSTYLSEHRDRTMVVLAGFGHIAYGFGIPSRVERRMPGIQYSILINDPGDDMVPEAGDFFLFPPHVEVEKAPKLGIVLTDDHNRIEIKQVISGSPADKGGVKAGDVLVSFDGHPVHDINDLKIELFFKKKGERAKLVVKRDGKSVELETGPLNSTSFMFGAAHGPGMRHGMHPGSMTKENIHPKP